MIVVALMLYFGLLFARGGHDAWASFRVPASSYVFKDLLSVTATWECVRDGADPRSLMERNACDPAGQRPANYPRLWSWPGHLGLGTEHTTLLGVCLAVLFLSSVLWLARGSSVGEGLVWALAVTSPAVMLGVERGNVDLAVFSIVVTGVALLRGSPGRRVTGHLLLLLAAMLKLFPAFGLVVLLRQPGRWRTWGTGLVLGAFGAYCMVTLGDIKTFVPAVPRQVDWSFGAAVIADALDARSPVPMTVVLVLVALGAAVLLAARERASWVTMDDSEAVDAFVVGAAIFVGCFAVFQSWDYRLAYLLLALPALLGWARSGASAVPFPRTTVMLLVAGLWLSAQVTVLDPAFPWDELVLWALFVTLAAGLCGVLAPAIGSGRLIAAPSPGGRDGG